MTSRKRENEEDNNNNNNNNNNNAILKKLKDSSNGDIEGDKRVNLNDLPPETYAKIVEKLPAAAHAQKRVVDTRGHKAIEEHYAQKLPDTLRSMYGTEKARTSLLNQLIFSIHSAIYSAMSPMDYCTMLFPTQKELINTLLLQAFDPIEVFKELFNEERIANVADKYIEEDLNEDEICVYLREMIISLIFGYYNEQYSDFTKLNQLFSLSPEVFQKILLIAFPSNEYDNELDIIEVKNCLEMFPRKLMPPMEGHEHTGYVFECAVNYNMLNALLASNVTFDFIFTIYADDEQHNLNYIQHLIAFDLYSQDEYSNKSLLIFKQQEDAFFDFCAQYFISTGQMVCDDLYDMLNDYAAIYYDQVDQDFMTTHAEYINFLSDEMKSLANVLRIGNNNAGASNTPALIID